LCVDELDSKACFEEVLKGQKIRDMIKKMGRILPVGSLKHGRNWAVAIDYWNCGGKENIENGGYKNLKPKPPIKIPDIGIYHHNFGVFTDLEQFIPKYGLDEKKQTVGIIFFRSTYFEQSKYTVNKLVQRLEPSINVIPVFASCDETNPKAFSKFFFRNDKPVINALLKVQCHRFYGPLGEDPRIMLDLIEKLKCPIFMSTPTYLREISKWGESQTGLMPVEVVVNVMRPELDGCIEPIVIGGLASSGFSKELDMEIKGMGVIDNRVSRCTSRTENWLKLQRKSNSEKRVAIIIYNYPPGEDNLGNASYLDVFASIEKLLNNLPSHIPSIDSSTSSLNIDLSHVDRREMGLRENN
jgi:cobaltochelatase CobN